MPVPVPVSVPMLPALSHRCDEMTGLCGRFREGPGGMPATIKLHACHPFVIMVPHGDYSLWYHMIKLHTCYPCGRVGGAIIVRSSSADICAQQQCAVRPQKKYAQEG